MEINKINTAILGYGFSGSVFFAPFLDLHDGFNLVGALERNKKRIQKDYPDVKSFDNINDVLQDPSIELVVVNTPIDTHYELATSVLKAGKHAIVEKTFTNSAEEAASLYILAKEKGLSLFVYQNRRFDSDFLTVEKVLQSGKLGQIVEATFSYDLYRPELRGDVHSEQPWSGGEFNNRGSHVIDQAIKVFGLPNAVLADFAAFRPNSLVEDYFEITFTYTDKRIKVRGTDIALEQQWAYVIQGLRGSFLKSRSDRQETLLLKGAKPSKGAWCDEPVDESGILTYQENGKTIREAVATEEGNYYAYFESVYQSLRHEAPILVSGLDGYKTLLVMDAARQSAREGRWIKIDADKYEIAREV